CVAMQIVADDAHLTLHHLRVEVFVGVHAGVVDKAGVVVDAFASHKLFLSAESNQLKISNLINDFSLICRSSFCPLKGRPQPDRMPCELTERLSRTDRHSASGSKQRRQLLPPPPPPVAGITHSRASRRRVRR